MGIKMNLQEFFLSVWTRFDRAFLVEDRWKLYLEGLGNTLLIALMATIIGVVLGIIFAVINYVNKKTGKLKPLSVIANIYITVVRGTPVVLQLMIMYFVVFVSWNFDVTVGGVELFDSSLLIGAITFGLNSAAYVAEITRAGFEAVDDGQREAGRSLGLSTAQTMWYIIIPQAIKNILPALGNELIALLKETSVAGYVAVIDLTRAGNLIRNNTYDAVNPLMVVALTYLALVILLTNLLKRFEKRLAGANS